LNGSLERLFRGVVALVSLLSAYDGEADMTKLTILHAGFVAAAMLITPAMAQEATQEPGAMGQHYPEVDYLTGGYGSRGTPGPGYYFWRNHRGYAYGPPVYGPVGLAAGVVEGAIGTADAIVAVPFDHRGAYAYYGGPPY
jgi:hypothetical protein